MKHDTRPFHFKQFSMYHHQSTMKIGTDAVLLGIWTDVSQSQHILDIGSGSGILALLLACRTQSALIDAVEIDKASFLEANQNFISSPFSDRLKIIHDDFSRFSGNSFSKYDLIVSNPPFFIHDLISENRQKTLARHTVNLSYEQLLDGVTHLLKPDGIFSVVLPYYQSRIFLKMVAERSLFLQKEMLIFPKPCKEPNRVNLQFGFVQTATEEQKLSIRNEDGGFTKQYLAMVDDYYIFIN